VNKLATLVLLVLMMALSNGLAATPSCATPQTADEKAVQAKAHELMVGKTARLDKILTLQIFVRDEIGQAKTEFG
jgi:hypothetical protein